MYLRPSDSGRPLIPMVVGGGGGGSWATGAALKAKTSDRLRTCCRVFSCIRLRSITVTVTWDKVIVFLHGAMSMALY